jgi:hypothetical protein
VELRLSAAHAPGLVVEVEAEVRVVVVEPVLLRTGRRPV